MRRLVLAIYDYLRTRNALFWSLLIALVLICGLLVSRLRYKEDITDFLPLSPAQQQAMRVYQDISGAERIVIIFEGGDTDTKLDAIDRYAALLQERDSSLASLLTTQIDIAHYLDILHQVYEQIPYFLTDADYRRMDSLLASGDFVSRRMAENQRMMQMPVSSFLHRTIGDDPLGLFTPVIASLQSFQPLTGGFSSLDGYMLSEDEHLAFALIQTPYGANETRRNTDLVKLLNEIGQQVSENYPELSVRLLGAPVIAVENASRIKKDSLIAVSLAVVLIMVVLCWTFRRERKAMLYILLTVAFGQLFGMAVMSVVCREVSLIVLGIGSIIIGIAVNYPLHILFHRRYTTSVRQTLEEVVTPLVIGNITTIGAFLTLVPLQAVALRDLGIFAASMLAGTILFTILFLPRLMDSLPAAAVPEERSEVAPSSMSPIRRYTLLALIGAVTVGLFFAGRQITFDADISHMNYMTEQQRADFAYFTALAGETATETVYLMEPQSQATCPDSLTAYEGVRTVLSAWRWLPDSAEQQRRLARWTLFCDRHAQSLLREINRQASSFGFRPETFASFANILTAPRQPLSMTAFAPIAESILQGYYIQRSEGVTLVTRVGVEKEQVADFEKQAQERIGESSLVFDLKSLHGSITRQLSENFDYIGYACSLLVFFFLVLTMRSWRAALVSFIPMVISWIWILGIMHLLGLQFNIVNIILATFIFGQGDDYTIFVVEGLQYEYRTGRRMLSRYRGSIILSALIMFLGIGVLVVARHPAMYSLGVVTLIGMSVVILTANIIPPLLRELLFGRPNPIYALIPQRPPMVMIDRVVRTETNGIVTALTVRNDNIFLRDNTLEESGLIEHMAQTAAALAGVENLRSKTAPKVGFIGEVKAFECNALPKVGDTLTTTLTTVAEMAGVTLVEATTCCAEQQIAHGQLKIVIQN